MHFCIQIYVEVIQFIKDTVVNLMFDITIGSKANT